MAALTAAGYDGWVTVELDAWDDPLAGAAGSRSRSAARDHPVDSSKDGRLSWVR
jgi:sugar phosphate isomerase/epimerase